jgi:hypothetical protein
LWLGADLTVDRAHDEYTSLAGEQTYELRWAEDSATYELVFTDSDGHQERRSFGIERLPPTWGLGLIALSELITRSTHPAVVPALSVAFQASSPDDFGPFTMAITPLPDDGGDRTWVVKVDGPVPSERRYRFTPEGHFVEMSESFMGVPRRVVPAQEYP